MDELAKAEVVWGVWFWFVTSLTLALVYTLTKLVGGVFNDRR